METPNHLETDELFTISKNIEKRYINEIHHLGAAVQDAVTAHNLCHHNLAELCNDISSMIFSHAMYRLPSDVKQAFERNMEYELQMLERIDEIAQPDDTLIINIVQYMDTDENLTGETDQNDL